MTRERFYALLMAIKSVREAITDETALDVKDLFEEWKPDTEYKLGKRVLYEDDLYRVEQQHTSQAQYPPPMVPALYTKIAKPGEIPVWRQPTGAQDGYDYGDEVWYPDVDDDIWVSDYEGKNVWAPGVYGWHKKEAES